ncbi:MAG TPA: SGNH/GDSL hydrolase family protein [Candidatus Magasanikbacteria bacterium]|nr:SGNH/GDSL hydrolase family protein [Candidatus Magasanikbacteria bacterium]
MKILLIFLIVALLSIGLYLNRSYAHIYDTIDSVGLQASLKEREYTISSSVSTSQVVYVAIGDSLTSGVGTTAYEMSYPYKLGEKIAENGSTVILRNYSYPGARTKGIIENVLPLVQEEKADIITILLGINDVHGNVSLTDFREQYSQILKELTSKSDVTIYTIALPFIGAPALLSFPYQYYFDWRTRKFNRVIEQLSAETHVHFIDLYSPTEKLFKEKGFHYSADFFHPSEEGYRMWSTVIYDRLNY